MDEELLEHRWLFLNDDAAGGLGGHACLHDDRLLPPLPCDGRAGAGAAPGAPGAPGGEAVSPLAGGAGTPRAACEPDGGGGGWRCMNHTHPSDCSRRVRYVIVPVRTGMEAVAAVSLFTAPSAPFPSRATMRPGTVDYSRWEHLKPSSSDDDKASPASPPPAQPAASPDAEAAREPRIAPPNTPLAAPPQPSRAPEAAAECDNDETCLASLRVLLSHPGALRLLGGGASNPKAGDPFLDAKLPAELAAALRAVTRANDATRGAARLATLNRAMRDEAARLRHAELWDLCLRRERVFRSIVAALKDADKDDERERAAGPRQYDPDVYYDSDEEEARGNALACLLMGSAESAARALDEMASWSAMAPDVPGFGQPAVTKLARQLAMRELEPARAILASEAEVQAARRFLNRQRYNKYLDQTGSDAPRAPVAPSIAQADAAASAAGERCRACTSEGVLMLKTAAMLDMLEALGEAFRSRMRVDEGA